MPGTIYLESTDFQGLNLDPRLCEGRPCVVMLQALWCGYCTQAKGAYNNLRNNKDVVFATIQADEQTEIATKLMKAKNLGGYPAYVGYNGKGELLSVHEGGRDEASLIKFANRLK